jgi:hypothetical protein
MGIISTHQIQNLREDDVRDFLCVHVCKYKILNLRNLIFDRIMLTCVLRIHVKLSKRRKLAFNVAKYLMFKILNIFQ